MGVVILLLATMLIAASEASAEAPQSQRTVVNGAAIPFNQPGVAAPIRLQSEAFLPNGTLAENFRQLRASTTATAPVHAIVQFNAIPNQNVTQQLDKLGVKLLRYLPENAYFARISPQVQLSDLQASSIRWIGQIFAKDKMSPRLASGEIGAWAVRPDGTADLQLRYFPNIDTDELARQIRALGGQTVSLDEIRRSMIVRIGKDMAGVLAGIDSVMQIAEAPPLNRANSNR